MSAMNRYVLTLFLGWVTTAVAQTSVTMEQALKSIAANNIALQSVRCDHEASALELKSENALSGPSVEYSPFYKDGYNGLAESELIVSEEFDFPTKYAARSKQGKLQQQVFDQQYLSARREVLLEAQLVCFEIIHANQSLSMLNQRLAGSESLLQMFQKRMETGDANILELNKVKLDRMEVLTQVSETQNERHRLLGRLQELNGGQAIELSDTLYPEQPLDIDFPSFLQKALAADADILSAEANARVSKHESSMSRQEWLPSLTLGYRRNTEGKEAVNGFVVGASFPILWSGSKAKAARKRQASAELQLQDARLSAEVALQTNYRELQGLKRVLTDYDVEMMRQMLVLLDKALQHGQISALQYYAEIAGIYEKLEAQMTVQCEAAKLYARMYKWEL